MLNKVKNQDLILPHNLKIGQTYIHIDHACYIVCSGGHDYNLVNLESGNIWNKSRGMNGKDNEFKLIELEFTKRRYKVS